MRRSFVAACALGVALVSSGPSAPAEGATVLPGFQEQIVATFSRPTGSAFAPDGRLFVLEQTGRIRIVKNRQLLSTPFATFSVNTSSSRGLLGIAFDPDFTTNRYLYVFYV